VPIKTASGGSVAVKKLFSSLALLVIIALPGVVKADSFTVWAPFTAPDTAGAAGANPGGPQQFDLDHHNAYTWRLSNLNVPAGQTITGASLTFVNITNWDTNANKLFVHMLNTATSFTSATSIHSATVNGVTTYFGDATGSPVPADQISDFFTAGANDIKLGEFVDTNGVATTQNVVFTFNQAQLTALLNFLNTGGDVAFGFDPDCHYWNNGIKFEYTTSPTATPEPATMTLLGTGLASLYYRRRRQQQQREQQ
jgi:hypothetical protein